MSCDIESEILAAIDRVANKVDDNSKSRIDIDEYFIAIHKITDRVFSSLPKWVQPETQIHVTPRDIGEKLGFGLKSKYIGNITIRLPDCLPIEREFFFNDDIVYGVYVVDGNVTNDLDAAIFAAREAFWEERNQEVY